MLSDTNYHILGWCHVYHGRFTRVGIRDPKRDRESVCVASEDNRQRAHEVEEESGEAIFIS